VIDRYADSVSLRSGTRFPRIAGPLGDRPPSTARASKRVSARARGERGSARTRILHRHEDPQARRRPVRAPASRPNRAVSEPPVWARSAFRSPRRGGLTGPLRVLDCLCERSAVLLAPLAAIRRLINLDDLRQRYSGLRALAGWVFPPAQGGVPHRRSVDFCLVAHRSLPLPRPRNRGRAPGHRCGSRPTSR
jgi:hypothetical protein